MKFKVRDGFVVRIVSPVDLGNGRTEQQENSFFAGQLVDMDAATAELHAHKIEPQDKQSAAFMDAKPLVSTPASTIGVTPETLALAKAMAAEIVAQVLSAQSPNPAPLI
ncbi:MAG: hypothetical protein AB9M53_00440 [Leptothrix sp. (in: b-proteobacteria)]